MKLICKNFRDAYDFLCHQYKDDLIVFDRKGSTICPYYRNELDEIFFCSILGKHEVLLWFCGEWFYAKFNKDTKKFDYNNDIKKYFSQELYFLNKKVLQVNQPIVCFNVNFNFKSNELYLNPDNFNENINLKIINFYCNYTPLEVYTKIYNFLSAQKDIKITEPTDEIKIKSHGFDKNSFRGKRQ